MTVEKNKTRALLSAAGLAISEGVERPERFRDGEEFRRSLIRALETHAGFGDAAKAFHTRAVAAVRPGQGQVARRVVPAGRVQAPRRDTPKGRGKA